MKYLYCITRNNGSLNHDGLLGLEGEPLQSINHQGLVCFVTDTDTKEKELNREAALAHEKVLEAIMEQDTIIPIAFGHVAEEQDIKEKLLEVQKTELEKWLENLNDKIELSLKALWLDLKPVFTEIAESNETIKRMKARGSLSRDDQIRAGEIAAKSFGKKRETLEQEIMSHLKDLAIEHKQTKLFGEQMITNLAFLINRSDLALFDKKVNEFGDRMGDNIKLKYTGPVPPFNFVDLKINFT